LALLTGNGVQLHGTQTKTILTNQHGFIEFEGEEAIASTLCDGSVRDFNVMTARGLYQANITLLQQDTVLTEPHTLLFINQGSWLINQQLCPVHSGLFNSASSLTLQTQSQDAQIFAIQIKKI
jgi:environmental stress-induced protein Ves